MATLASLAIDLTANSALLVKEIKKANKSIDGFGKQAQNAARVAAKSFAAIFAVGKIKQFGESITQTAASFETLKASLETVFGSQKAAADQFRRIEEFASRTPMSVQQVTEAFIKMKAFGLNPTTESLESMINTSSTLGKSLDQFVEAIADAARGQFERLQEFGISARKENEKVKVSFQGVTTEIGNNSREIQNYLLDIGRTSFAGAMQRKAETLDGVFSTLQGSVDVLAAKIANDSGLVGALKSAAKWMTEIINDAAKVEEIEIEAKIDNVLEAMLRLEKGNFLRPQIGRMKELQGELAKLEAQLSQLKESKASNALSDQESELDAEIKKEKDLIEAKMASQEALRVLENEERMKKQEQVAVDFEGLIERLATERELLQSKFLSDLELADEYYSDKEGMEEEHQKTINKIKDKFGNDILKSEKRRLAQEKSEKEKNFKYTLSAANAFFGAMASQSKSFAIAEAITNTWLGVSQSLAAYPMPAAAIFAAAHLASGLQAVDNIRSQSKGGSIGSGAGAVGIQGIEATNSFGESANDEERTKTVILRVDGVDDESLLTKGQVRKIVDQINEEREANVRIIL